MGWLVARMQWIMLVSGALTLTMLHAAISPSTALLGLFGETLDGPLAQIIVRNWGASIALVGAMLIYGAFRPPVRPLVLVVAATSKLIFITLILRYGLQYLGHQAGVALVVDSVMVVVFLAYLAATWRATPPRRDPEPSL